MKKRMLAILLIVLLACSMLHVLAAGDEYTGSLVHYYSHGTQKAFTTEVGKEMDLQTVLSALGIGELDFSQYNFRFTNDGTKPNMPELKEKINWTENADGTITLKPEDTAMVSVFMDDKTTGQQMYNFVVNQPTHPNNQLIPIVNTLCLLYDNDTFYIYDEVNNEKLSGALPYKTIEAALDGAFGFSTIHTDANFYYKNVKILIADTYVANHKQGSDELMDQYERWDTSYRNASGSGYTTDTSCNAVIQRFPGFTGVMVRVETYQEQNLQIFDGIEIDNNSNGANLTVFECVNQHTGEDDYNPKDASADYVGDNSGLLILHNSRIFDSTVNLSDSSTFKGTAVHITTTMTNPGYDSVSGAIIENHGGALELDNGCKIEGFEHAVKQEYGVTRFKNTGHYQNSDITIHNNINSITLYPHNYMAKWDLFPNGLPSIRVNLHEVKQWKSGDIVLGSGYYWVPGTEILADGNSAYDLRWAVVTEADRNAITFQNGQDLGEAMGLNYYSPYPDQVNQYQDKAVLVQDDRITEPYPVIRFQKWSVYNVELKKWYYTLAEAAKDPELADGHQIVIYESTKETESINLVNETIKDSHITIRASYEGEQSKGVSGMQTDDRAGDSVTVTWNLMNQLYGIQLSHGADLTLTAQADGHTCGTLTLNANGLGRIIDMYGGNVLNIHDGVTLTGGNDSTYGYGGAIMNMTSTINMTGGTIEGNTSIGTGGAISNMGGTINLSGGTIQNNSAALGDGIYQNGTFNLSGNPVFSDQPDEDVYLPATATDDTASGFNVITKAGEFEFTTPLKVTLGNENKNLYDGRNVVESGAADGDKEIAETDLAKFILTNLTGYDTEYFTKLDFVYTAEDETPNGNEGRDVLELDVETTVRTADLVITKTVSGTPDQSFLFKVTGDGVDLIVVIPTSAFNNGTGSATVKELLIGEYTVTELTDWSWRYEVAANGITAETDEDAAISGSEITFELTADGETVTFNNTRTEDKWLDGDCYCENIFE